MAGKLSARTTGLLLLLLAAVCWALVAGERALAHAVSLTTVVTAVLLTGIVLAWPFLHGTRVSGARVMQLETCRLCGTLPVPGLKFCIRCGAYPKAKPQAHQA